MTMNEANDHKGAQLLDHPLDDVLDSTRDYLQRENAMMESFPLARSSEKKYHESMTSYPYCSMRGVNDS